MTRQSAAGHGGAEIGFGAIGDHARRRARPKAAAGAASNCSCAEVFSEPLARLDWIFDLPVHSEFLACGIVFGGSFMFYGLWLKVSR